MPRHYFTNTRNGRRFEVGTGIRNQMTWKRSIFKKIETVAFPSTANHPLRVQVLKFATRLTEVSKTITRVNLLIDNRLQYKLGTWRTLWIIRVRKFNGSRDGNCRKRTISNFDFLVAYTRSVRGKQTRTTCHVIGGAGIDYPRRKRIIVDTRESSA